MNPDGSLDKSLRADLPANFIPYKMEIMSSGDILVYDYTSVIRLGPNGRLKNQMDVEGISSITPLANGKFFVCTWLGGLFRYRANFTLDPTFPNQTAFADGPITDIAIQESNYIICGSFATVNGQPKNDLAQIRPNGTVDSSFDTGTGTDDFIISIVLNPADGKIYPGGYINSFDGVFGFAGMARLNWNGSIDASFMPISYGGTNNIFFTADHKIITSGYAGLNKLNYDGTVDENFSKIEDAYGFALVVEQLTDSSLLAVSLKGIGGDYGIVKYSATGSAIPGFSPPVARLGTITSMDRFRSKLVVAGDFFMLNKHRSNNVARLNANGSVDVTFKSVNDAGAAYKCSVLPDGKVLMSGVFDLIRLNQNGAVDPTFEFNPYLGLYQVEYFHAQDDGKIIGAGPNGVYRLNADGSGDDTFDVGTGSCCYGSTAYGLDVQSSGRPVYRSFFDVFNGTPVNKMVRLNADASVDTTFDNGSGPNGPINFIRALGNDDLMVGGWFSQFDGQASTGGLVKLKKDGALDTTFQAAFTPSAPYFDLKEFNNRILTASFTDGKYRLTVLNQNGDLANDFEVPVQISSVNGPLKFFVRDNNTFYVLGNVTVEGQSRPTTITKVLYNPVLSTPALARSKPESTSELVKYQVYPNPSQREIIFDVSQSYDLRIVKFTGETVMEKRIDKGNNTVDISNLRPDTYVIQLVGGGRKQTSILIKD